MKKIFLSLIITLFTNNIFAVEKICFFANGSYGSKGDRFFASVSLNQLKVVNDNSDVWIGTYNELRADQVGRDGVTYLSFRTHLDDGCSTILVDKKLAEVNGKGLIKFICRGEGFSQDSYYCRDNN